MSLFYLKTIFRKYTRVSWRKTDRGGDIEWNETTERRLRMECGEKPLDMERNRRILFIGLSGEGKTTLITNLVSALADSWENVGGMYGSKKHFPDGVTGEVKEIPLASHNVSFIDCKGLSIDRLSLEKMKNCIGGKQSIEKAESDTINPPKADCVVFVLNAQKVGNLSDTFSNTCKDVINQLMKHAEDKGVSFDFVLTKCELEDTRLQDPSYIPYIFFSPIIRRVVEEAHQIFQIPANRIHPVVNNTQDTTPIMEQKILQMLALKNIVSCVRRTAPIV